MPDTAATEPYSLTVGEVAAILGVNASTVRAYTDSTPPALSCRRLPGNHRRFRRSDVEALLAPQTEAAS